MMTNISNSELALLSLVVEQPRHAYEIEQVIEERNMRYWTEIGFSSIYRLLNKLEEAGYLEAKMQPPEGRGPARKVYHPTAEGKKVWQTSVLSHLESPERQYSSFLLGLDNFGALPIKEVQLAIRENLSHQQAVYDHLSQGFAAHPMKGVFYIDIFFDYMLHQLSSEIAWLEKFEQRLESLIPEANSEGGNDGTKPV